MIQDLFSYNSQINKVELNVPEIMLVSEFKALLEPKRNICKEDKTGKKALRAFRELTYIWLALSWKSIYANYDEQERHMEALNDANITEKEFEDPVFRQACRKFKEIQESNKSVQLLQAANKMVDKFIDYFESVDPLERDMTTGKPIFKVKDIQAEMKNLTEVHTTLIELENQVKKQLEASSTMRGNAREDFDPGDF